MSDNANQPEPKLNCLGTIILFVVAFGFLISIVSSCSCAQDKNRDPIQDNAEACTFAEEAIKSALIAPSTAKVKFNHSEIYFEKQTKMYSIPGYVDAENSFGAKIRKHFTVYVQTDGMKGYRVVGTSWE